MDLSSISDEAKQVAASIAHDDITCDDCEMYSKGCCWERVLADSESSDYCARMAAIVERVLSDKNDEIEALNNIITTKFEGSLPARFKLDVENKTLVCTFPTVPEEEAASVAAELSKAFAAHVESALKNHTASELREYALMIEDAYGEGWEAANPEEGITQFDMEWDASKAKRNVVKLRDAAKDLERHEL